MASSFCFVLQFGIEPYESALAESNVGESSPIVELIFQLHLRL